MSKRIGRNDPCPCGSGKKYKKCCLPEAEALDRELPLYMQDLEDTDLDLDEDLDPFAGPMYTGFEESILEEHEDYREDILSDKDFRNAEVNPRMHVIMHAIVENQLIANEPPETAETLKRLMDRGMDRHDAIHLIGSLVAKMIFHIMKDKKPADTEGYRQELRDLNGWSDE